MWISFLNFDTNEIVVEDISKIYNDDFNSNEYLNENGYPNTTGAMITDDCPIVILNNVETHLNL